MTSLFDVLCEEFSQYFDLSSLSILLADLVAICAVFFLKFSDDLQPCNENLERSRTCKRNHSTKM